MSADNWTICPRCKINADRQQRKNEEAMIKAYGKVGAEEYERLRDIVLNRIEREESLREDYEQSMDDAGNYYVHYSCACSKCGFHWEFEHGEKVKP